MDDTKRLYSPSEVETILGLTRPGLNRAAQKLGVGTIIGNTRVYSAADLEALRGRRTGTGPPTRGERYSPIIVHRQSPRTMHYEESFDELRYPTLDPDTPSYMTRPFAEQAFAQDRLVQMLTTDTGGAWMFEVLGVTHDLPGMVCVEWVNGKQSDRLKILRVSPKRRYLLAPIPVPGSAPDGGRTYEERHGQRLITTFELGLKTKRDIVRFVEPEIEGVE